MKRFLAMIAMAAFLATSGVVAMAYSGGPGVTADEAISKLKEGNQRFVAGANVGPHQDAARRHDTSVNGQHPIAVVLGCSDSRVPAEVVFDQGVGDIFVIRVAGNLAGPDEMGTVEYGVGHLGTPVVLVLGHTACGAVTAAVQNAKVHGSIPALINQIKPAVAKAKSWNPTASGDDLLNKSIKANVWLTMENILRKSHEVREFVKNGKVLVVGGIYDLTTGQVAWLGQHPEQGKILVAAEHKPVHVKPQPKPAAAPEGEAKADEHGAAAPAAKPAAKSEGQGELLAPAPEKAPEKAPAKAAKNAHP